MAVLVARLCLLLCFTSRGVTTSITIDDNAKTWWEASRGCEQAGQKLLVPETEDDVDLLLNTIDDDQFHWIGGFSFISWKWTCDSTSFYKSVCLSELNHDTKVTNKGNSAFKCHQQCGKKFGLQGEHCFCLETTYKCKDTSTPVMRCKGNLDDTCGSDSLMSVFEVVIEFDSGILLSKRCVYAKKVERQSIFQLNNCLSYRSMAGYTGKEPGKSCVGNVKLTNGLKTWDTWNNETKLLKVTNNNIQTLTSEMKEFDHSYLQTYWIGLRGFLDSRWLFETNIPMPEPEDHGFDELCLSVRKASMNSSLIYNWTSCDFSFKSVCRKDNLSTTIATVTTTRISAEVSSFSTTNQRISTAAKPTFTTTNPERTTSTSTTTTTSAVKSSETQGVTSSVTSSLTTSELSTNAEMVPALKSNQRSSIGLYIGVPTGIVMVIGVIVRVFLYRNRRLRLSSSDQTNEACTPNNQSNEVTAPDEYDTLHVYATVDDPSSQYETICTSAGLYENIARPV